MPNYSPGVMGLYVPTDLQNDDFVSDFLSGLSDNFHLIDNKFGTSLVKDNKTYGSLVERLEEIETDIENLQGYDVTTFGAVGDGVTDSDAAFVQAIGSGNRIIRVPAGHFRVNQINLPSNTYLVGEGKGVTIISSNDGAPLTNTIVTNADWNNGNSNIYVKGMTVDWNRTGARDDQTVAAWRPEGCGVAMVYSTDCHVIDVESYDAKVHCFEVTSTRDVKTNLAQRVYIRDCKAKGGGDDNFTTHYCDHVYIEDCYSYDPGDPAHTGDGNNNCFEVDDGSRNVHVINCYGKGGVRGIEVKAHQDPPAPDSISLLGCTMENNIVGIGIRHIGRGYSTNPSSDTAFDVNMTDCTIINPTRNPGLYDAVEVAALYVANYKRVNISNMKIIGGADDVTADVCQFRFESELIAVSNLSISGFSNALTDIYVTGGENSLGRATFSGINIWQSAPNGIVTGSGINNCHFFGGQIIGPNTAESVGITMYAQGNTILGFDQWGYGTPCDIEGTIYNHIPNRLRSSFTAGTSTGHATAENAALLANTGGPKALSDRSAVFTSSGANEARGSTSTIISSYDSIAEAYTMILKGSRIINPEPDSIATGFEPNATPTSTSRTIELHGRNGTVKATGAITGGSSFSDYAEYFESLSGEAIPTGTIVTLEGDKIRPAEEGERMLGVISETAGSVLGEASFAWSKKFLTNEFGGYIYHDVTIQEEEESGEVTERTVTVPKENPDYDPEKSYSNRVERPEWNIVGLLGQLYMRIDDTVQAGDLVTAKNGQATSSEEGWQVMKVTTPYDSEKGYGVAFVFIR